MSAERFFVDSNLWLYTFMRDDEEKEAVAVELIGDPTTVLSTQVVNEICVNLIRKADYSEAEIQQTVENLYANYEIVRVDKQDIVKASQLRAQARLSYWDSLVVATAINAGCTLVYSEDMQHNQVIEKTRIVNPFKE